jgi:DNA ligase-1
MPSFVKPQLAHQFRGWNGARSYIGQPKLDGLRVAVSYDRGRAVGYSRTGHVFSNIDRPLASICEAMTDSRYGTTRALVDCEALVAGKWRLTSGLLRRQTLRPEDESLLDKIVFHVLDVVPLDGYQPAEDVPQSERDALVREIFAGHRFLAPIKSRVLRTMKDAETYYRDLLDDGYEGLMLKDPDGLYRPGARSHSWLKMKPIDTIDGRIIDFKPGEGKHRGRLGAIIVRVGGEEVGVGTGFTDEERERIWRARNRLVGRTLELSFQKDAQKVATCRFPTFRRIRGADNW